MSRSVELAKDTAQAAPAITIAATHTYFGYSLADWASILAIAYTALIIANQVRKNWIPWLASKPWTRSKWWT